MNEFLHHFLELWSDPAHFAYEVTVDLLVNTVFLGLLWPFIKRAVRRHDQETHGIVTSVTVEHDDEEDEYDPTPCCPDPGCPGRGGVKPCEFPGYADNH